MTNNYQALLLTLGLMLCLSACQPADNAAKTTATGPAASAAPAATTVMVRPKGVRRTGADACGGTTDIGFNLSCCRSLAALPRRGLLQPEANG